ncbi:unnamed protein product [Alternaria sp. RS040]
MLIPNVPQHLVVRIQDFRAFLCSVRSYRKGHKSPTTAMLMWTAPCAISPHTPSPVTLYENVSVLNDLDYHQYDDSWFDEMHMLDGFGFEVSAADFPQETWVVPNSTNMVPTEQVPWSLYDLPELQYKPDESASHLGGMASSAQYQFGNDLDSIQPESTFYRPTVTDMTVLTSAPFMYDLNAATSYAPV